MPLAELLMERFRVRTRAVENPVITSVGTTPVLVLQNNPNRLGWVMVNLSANTVYIAFHNDVSSSKGILLAPSGGNVSMIWDEDFQAVAWALWAVASGAASAIYIMEIVEY